ncbi:MAG: aldehyde dehydrogenase family protein [Bacteroidota bacterium]
MQQTIANQTLKNLFEGQQRYSRELRHAPLRERKGHLRKLRAWLLAHRTELALAVKKDLGKSETDAEIAELFPVLVEIGHVLEHLDSWARPKKVDAPLTYLGTRSEIRYEPKGVCLIIGPWNFPFMLCISPLVSCLAAGNTAVLKPSEITPHTSHFIRQMVGELFEPNLVAVVEGGPEVSTELLKLPFDHIFFTGSPAVGKIVMRAAADNLSSVTLELGGKSPAIIDATARLADAAKRIAFGKFLNNGQTCIAPDYILIDEKVKEPFTTLLQKEIAALFGKGGQVTENASDYSRIVSKRHFQRLHQLVDDAIQRGARPLLSGQANAETLFFPPMLLDQVPLDAALMEEEIFGPVLPIIGLTDIGQAIQLVNQKPKPLSLYIFSNSNAFRERVLQQTSAGTVAINDCVLQFTHPNIPFGGVNNSGIGKAHGHYGFLAFSNEKPVVKQKGGVTNAYFFYPPYTRTSKRLLNFLFRWFV